MAERYSHREDKNKNMKKLISDLLIKLGENPKRDGLKQTPERVEKSLAFLLFLCFEP